MELLKILIFRAFASFYLISVLIQVSHSIFCSAYCKPNSCSGKLSNQCTDCTSPFILQSNGTCTVDPASGYVLFNNDAQISNSISSTGNCGTYTFIGLTAFDTVSLRSATSINIPHYSVRLIAWIIMYNEWDLSLDYFQGVLDTSGQTIKQYANTYSTAQLLCSWSTSNQWYMRLDMEFAHNQLANKIRIDISTNDVQVQPWGIKQYMFLVGKCDVSCQVCNDGTPSNCSQCSSGYLLSGTICNTTCAQRYGFVSNNNTCVACSLYCTVCAQAPTNCSSCETIGSYQSYLSVNSCLVNCPSYFTKQTSTHKCISCTSVVCVTCQEDLPINCFQCSSSSFWLNFTCYSLCPVGYFPSSSNCTKCSSQCFNCSGLPDPCFSCNSGYFLSGTQCVSVCPTGYFGHVPSGICLLCAGNCVTSSATMNFNSDNTKLITTITFSKQLDFNYFPFQTFQSIVSMDSNFPTSLFIITFNIIDSYSYQIILTPKSTINMTNVNFTMTMNPKVQEYYSIDFYPLDISVYSVNTSTLWTLLKLPQLSDTQKAFISIFENFNDNLNNGLNQKFTQQIKKSGFFGILFSGAQLSSLTVLHNNAPAKNFYEAARFWSSFIYFQVPKWQKSPQYTKYVVSQACQSIVPSIIQSFKLSSSYKHLRILQSVNNQMQNWRFIRTGHTQFIIFDCYMNIALIILSWVLLIIPKVFQNKMSVNLRSIFYNILHKVHQIGLFFITMGVALQWITFSYKNNSDLFKQQMNYVYSSFGVSMIAMVYYLIYQVYIFYKLIPYGSIEASSKKYKMYVQKYSYFLRDLRFEEFETQLAWNYRHLIRPYNYQILYCIRLILLVCAMPIFHSQPLASICTLVLIQLFQLVRYTVTWPYQSLMRNLSRLILQLLLLLIFVIQFANYLMFEKILQSINVVLQQQLRNYFIVGWVGFALIYLYNIIFIIYQIADFVAAFRWTNQERVESSRREYYYNKLAQYQQNMFRQLTKNETASIFINPAKQIVKLIENDPKKQKYENKAQTVEKVQKLTISAQIANRTHERLSKIENPILLKSQLSQVQNSMLNQYKKLNEDTKLSKPNTIFMHRYMIEKMIQKGNLINRQYGDLPVGQIKIQQYEITHSQKEHIYNIKIYKVTGVFMRQKIITNSRDHFETNLFYQAKDVKQIKLHKNMNHEYFIIIDEIFKSLGTISTNSIFIRTFLKVDLNLYKPSQQIPQNLQNLSQWIQVCEHNGSVFKQKLDRLLPGFPICYQILQNL